MSKRSLDEFIRYVKDRAYNAEIRYGKTVYVSVFFISNGNKEGIIIKKKRKALSNIANIILENKPSKLIVEINADEQLERHDYTLEFFNEVSQPQTKAIPVYENPSFAGLGEVAQANIESIVNKRLEEERKERELLELKQKLVDADQKLTSNKSEIESLKGKIEAKENEIAELEGIIEKKKTLKYYASLTGDILQSFGIKKEAIASPLAGLLGAVDEDEHTAIEQQASADNSGIVEEATPNVAQPQSQRDEMIQLITLFLKQVDNPTLHNVFSIFSEIENQPSVAVQIIQFLQNLKQK